MLNARTEHFYPRPPHGERPYLKTNKYEQEAFLSTPPAWGATRQKQGRKAAGRDFYPRPPHGERRRQRAFPRGIVHFYPRPPHGERHAVRA